MSETMHPADYFSKLATVSPIAYAMFSPHLSVMFPIRDTVSRPIRWGELALMLPVLYRQFPHELNLKAKGILLSEAEVKKYVLPHVPKVVMPNTQCIRSTDSKLLKTILDNIYYQR